MIDQYLLNFTIKLHNLRLYQSDYIEEMKKIFIFPN